MSKKIVKGLVDLVIIVVGALVFSFLIKTFLFRAFFIPSGSMEHTLEVEDRVVVNQLVPKVFPLNHGDIIVFRDPGGWLYPRAHEQNASSPLQQVLQFVGLAADTNDQYLIKRVIGLPGDHVSCCDVAGHLSVNGVSVEEPYAVVPSAGKPVSAVEFDVTVPEGSLWVMGDNRYASKDSRFNRETPSNGFVKLEEVVGRADVIAWPLNRMKILGNYPESFEHVPKH